MWGWVQQQQYRPITTECERLCRRCQVGWRGNVDSVCWVCGLNDEMVQRAPAWTANHHCRPSTGRWYCAPVGHVETTEDVSLMSGRSGAMSHSP